MQRSGTTKVYRDTSKMLGMLAVGAVFFGACFAGFLSEAHAGRLAAVKEVEGWIATPILCILMLGFAAKLLDRRAAVEFADEGLLARDISPEVIPWPAICQVSIRHLRSNKFVEVQIDPTVARGLHLTWRHSKFGFISKLFGFQHYYISTVALDHDADYLVDLMDFYRKKNETVK